MNLDDLKEKWQLRHGELAGPRFDELASHVRKRALAFQRKILKRDLIETAAAIFVIAAFGAFQLWGGYPWLARVGMCIIVLGAIEIVVVLHWTRRSGDRSPRDLPLSGFCAAEIARVDRQIRLLRTVNWWYTGPLLVGIGLFWLGLLFSGPLALYVSLPAFAVLGLAVLVFGWVVHRINQRAVAEELTPLRDELAAVHAALVDDPTKS